MLKLKGCPRCSGDIYFDWDFAGWFEQCLQCGRMKYLRSDTRSRQPALEIPKAKAKALKVSRAA